MRSSARRQVVLAVRKIGLAHGEEGRGTVGCLVPYPASPNVIPGRVEMTVDFRHASEEVLERHARGALPFDAVPMQYPTATGSTAPRSEGRPCTARAFPFTRSRRGPHAGCG